MTSPPATTPAMLTSRSPDPTPPQQEFGSARGSTANAPSHLGTLRPDRATALEQLGVIWHTPLADGEAAIRAFHAEHGHTNVPTGHVTADGFPLGTWVQSSSAGHRNNPEGVHARYPYLDELNFTWQLRNPDTAWHDGITHLTEHTTRWGLGTWIPSRYTAPDGYRLGAWVMNRRADYWQHRLTPARTSELTNAGIIWRHRATPDTAARQRAEDIRFTQLVRRCQEWADTHDGALSVPVRHTTPDQIRLGRWLLRQRALHRAQRLPQHRATQLDAINPAWSSH